MKRNEMIEYICSFDNCKNPGFSVTAVGHALHVPHTDNRLEIVGDLSDIPDRDLAKVVEYIQTALKTVELEFDL